MGITQSYYYFQYSDISGSSISEASGGVIYQTDACLNELSVAQCANYGISLLGTDMGNTSANFMVLTTDSTSTIGEPRLEFYEQFSNYFIYDPSSISVNNNKQLFCASNNVLNIKNGNFVSEDVTDVMDLKLPQEAINNTINNLPSYSGFGGFSISTPYWQTPTDTVKFVVTCPKTSNDASGSAIIYKFSPTTSATTQDSVITPTRNFDGINGVEVISSCIWRLEASNEYYLALGAPSDISNETQILGAVYIYHYTGSAWVPRQCLYSNIPEDNELFGWSISLGGLNLVVGAPRSNLRRGRCYTFLGNSNWTGITSTNTMSGTGIGGGQFGFSVSIHTNSGTSNPSKVALAIGSGAAGGGQMRPYYSTDSGQSFISASPGIFSGNGGYGQNVSIGGNDINTSRGIIVAGSPGHYTCDVNGTAVGGGGGGFVYVYLSNDPTGTTPNVWTSWTEIHHIIDPSPNVSGQPNWGYFGQSVSYKSPYIFIGQPGDVYGQASNYGVSNVSDVSAGYVYKYFNDGQDVSATFVSKSHLVPFSSVNTGIGLTIDGICDKIVSGSLYGPLPSFGLWSLSGVTPRDTINVYIVDISTNSYQDISFANPILFTPQTWTDNANIPITPSTYFQYSNKAGDSVDAITFNAPQITDFSNNYSLCAQYASRFLGTGGINAAGEEKERKYFVLYADDTNTANRRIAFLSDISGAYFNDGSTGTQDISGRQIFCNVVDTSAVTDAYWDGTDMSMASATPFYFDEDKWMKEAPSAPDTVMYYASSNILDNTICEFPVGTFPNKNTQDMAEYANKFLGQTLVDASGIPRECKYYVLYTNDLSDNRIEFKYDYSGGTYDAISNCEDINTQVFCASANALNIWDNKTALEWDNIVEATPPDICGNDAYGYQVAVANNMVIVSAPGTSFYDYNAKGGRVLTWITDNSGSSWTQKTPILNPYWDTAVDCSSCGFGWSIDLICLSPFSVPYYLAAISEPGAPPSGGGAGSATHSGKVYLYKTLDNGDTWSLYENILGYDYLPTLGPAWTNFGINVALKESDYSTSSYVLAVSAPYHNSVFVFTGDAAGAPINIVDTLYDPGQYGDISGTGTVQIGPPGHNVASSAADYYMTRFGYRLAINGSFILVGAPGDRTSTTQDIYGGAAYLFRQIGTGNDLSWNFYQQLESFDISNGCDFGNSCSIDGGLCVIGNSSRGSSVDSCGNAYVFKGTNDTSWNQTAKLTDYLEPDAGGIVGFGMAISIKDNIILVGAGVDDWPTVDPTSINEGSVSIFYSTDDGLSWPQVRNFSSLNPANNNWFASAVALSENYAVIGEHEYFSGSTDSSGHAFIIPQSLIVDTTSDISNAPLRVFTNDVDWVDNCNDVSMTYFQYSNSASATTKNILITDSEIADFSNNFAKCAQHAGQFLGTASFDGNSEIVENKYFILYADDTNSENKRISFLSDISGAFFDQTDLSGRQIFCQLEDTSGVNSAYWSGTDNSMSYSTPLYFTEEEWLKTTPTPHDSNFYFQWSDISGYNIFDLPIGGAFDCSSIEQMASYGTSFLNKMLVDTDGVPRECKYFIFYTNDLSENRIQFKYDASGVNAGAYYSPETQDSSGLNYNRQIFCSSANAIVINEISNNNIIGGFDCSFSNEIKFYEDKWRDNGDLLYNTTSYFQWSDISGNKVDYIVYNSPQIIDISENYAKCACYASKFLGTVGLDPNNEQKERKYFVLYTDETDPSNLRIQFYSNFNEGNFYPNNVETNNKQVFSSIQNTQLVSLNSIDISYQLINSNDGNTWISDGVAFNDNLAVIGSVNASAGVFPNQDSGRAFIFDKTPLAEQWELRQILDAGTEILPTGGDFFGKSVDISNNLILIGSPCSGTFATTDSGKAFIFDYSNNTNQWEQIQILTRSAGATGIDEFGWSVKFNRNGNEIIVGAPDGNYGDQVFIFDYSNNTNQWEQIQNIQGVEDSFYGFSVSINGNYAIVGAPNFESNNSGNAYIYTYSTGTWQAEYPLSNVITTIANQNFGWSVDILGNTCVVGAKGDGTPDGKVYVFSTSDLGANWTNDTILTPTTFTDSFGEKVSLSENYLIVSDKFLGSYQDSGLIYLYNKINGIWSLIKIISEPIKDYFPTGIAIVETNDGSFNIMAGIENKFEVKDCGVFYSSIESDVSMNYATPLYFSESIWAANGALTPPDSNFYFQWSDISGYTISDIPIGGAFDGSSVAQMASYGTSFLNKILVDQNNIPRECRYFVLYTDDLSENRLRFFYDYSGASYQPSGAGNTQIFCSSANAININNLQTIHEWQESAKLTDSSPENDDLFGSATAVDGSFIVIGSSQFDTIYTGKALIYTTDNSGATWIYKQTLIPSDGQPNDRFGKDVAICQNIIVVGASQDGSVNPGSGAAYVFINNGTTWIQSQKLTASNGAIGDSFGYSVSISRNDSNVAPAFILVIGAYNHDSNSISDSGSAYVFSSTDDGNTWTLVQELDASDGFNSDFFGRAVAIDYPYIAIGAPGSNSYACSTLDKIDTGSVYMYCGTGGGLIWTFKQKIVSLNISSYEYFGSSVSLSGNLMVVGAYGDPFDPSGSSMGAAYIFITTDNGSTWTITQKIVPMDREADGNFGYYYSVAISGNVVLIGERNDGTNDEGAAYIFTTPDNGYTWVETNKLVASDTDTNDKFGRGTSLSSEYAVVGGSANDDGGTDTGSAYVFPKLLKVSTTSDISFANEIKFFENQWLNNGQLSDVSSSYFQWSDISDTMIDNIVYNAPQIADISENYAKCASYASSFLGTIGINPNGEEQERKYFVLYTDEADASSLRIQFYHDTSGAYFDPSNIGPNYNQQVFTSLPDTSFVSLAHNYDFSMSYATPLYFTESTWTFNGGLVAPNSNFYFQWSDISGYTIDDIPVGGAFDGSSVQQMASYGTSFLNKILVDNEGIPRECKYFVLYTNDLSENRIQFKYDASGDNAGVFYSPKTQYYNGLNYNKQVFCSYANAIIINEISNNITGGFDCSFSNEIKFFEDKWADNNQLVAPPTSFFRTSNIVAQYDGSANPQVDIISYNAPQLTGIANNYEECAAYASKFFGTIGLTDPSGTNNWEEKERKYFVLITDDTDPSAARIQFKYDASGAYYDPSCGAGGTAVNTQIFCPNTDIIPLQQAPGPNYSPYEFPNSMIDSQARYFSG